MRKQIGKIKDDALSRRYRRKLSIRSKVFGTMERPRICAFRSNKHLSVQVIDDVGSKTIFSFHTYGKKCVKGTTNTVEGAKLFGAKLAEELRRRGIGSAVFDRNGRPYTGVLASLVTSIREGGVAV